MWMSFMTISRLLKANEMGGQDPGYRNPGTQRKLLYRRDCQSAESAVGPEDSLAEKVSKAFNGIPVAVTNDANAAALGEMTYGAARGMKRLHHDNSRHRCRFRYRDQRSACIWLRRIRRRARARDCEARNNGRICGCGRTGCLETYCSATGVARTAREFMEIRKEPSLLRDLPPEEITSRMSTMPLWQEHKISKEIFEYTGKILGEAFCRHDNVFSSPQAIILFGGLAKSGEMLLKTGQGGSRQNVFPVFRGKTKILLFGIEGKRCRGAWRFSPWMGGPVSL